MHFNNNKDKTKPNCKFNKFFQSLQQVECFLNTMCKVNNAKNIVKWVKKVK